MTNHRITEVASNRRTWTAWCACGEHATENTRRQALFVLYQHVIQANRPPCPTPSKAKYGTQVEAHNAIAKFIAYASPGPRPIRAYECPSGQHWHTTKHPLHERKPA